jgi:hypothetical protein
LSNLPGEDGMLASNAGQMETILSVRGVLDEVWFKHNFLLDIADMHGHRQMLAIRVRQPCG